MNWSLNWSLNWSWANISLTLFLTANAAPLFADPNYEQKYPDFACDVDKGPLSPEEMQGITSESLKEMGKKPGGQEKIDRIYARLQSGPMPQGFYNGQIVFANSEATAGMRVMVAALGLPPMNDSFMTTIGETLWHGKVFKKPEFSAPGAPSAILGNKMPLDAEQKLLRLFNYPNVANAVQSVRTDAGWNQWRFPAKVYCGQSLLDSRRESIIIDYAHSESVVDPDQNRDSKINYIESIDQLADRNHLQVRDEIRMVRPGLYLGRAYMGRLFILNFTLECKEGECKNLASNADSADACSIGTQRIVNNQSQQCTSLAEFRNQ